MTVVQHSIHYPCAKFLAANSRRASSLSANLSLNGFRRLAIWNVCIGSRVMLCRDLFMITCRVWVELLATFVVPCKQKNDIENMLLSGD